MTGGGGLATGGDGALGLGFFGLGFFGLGAAAGRRPRRGAAVALAAIALAVCSGGATVGAAETLLNEVAVALLAAVGTSLGDEAAEPKAVDVEAG